MHAMGSPHDPMMMLFGCDPAGWDNWEYELAHQLAANDRYVTEFDQHEGPGSSTTPVHAVARKEGVPRLLERLRANERRPFASVTLIDPPADEDDRPFATEAPVLLVHDRTSAATASARRLAGRFPNARCLPTNVDAPDRLVPIVPAVLTIGVDITAQRARYRTHAGADPVGWFEHLYRDAEAGHARVPWDYGMPDPLLKDWMHRQTFPIGSTAIVVGCGLGRDAEVVAEHGLATTAFDVSETAIRWTHQRFGHSPVNYVVADLLDFPPDWTGSYDLVVECITLQALPASLRPTARQQVAKLVAPGGTLIVVALRPPANQDPAPGPPWSLTREEIDGFASDGLAPVRIEELEDASYAGRRERWRAEFRRP